MQKTSRVWRIFQCLLVGGLVVVLLCLFMVGPWPNYKNGLERADYLETSLARVNERSKKSSSAEPSTESDLRAGWARRSITPAVGGPLAGYGARKGKPSTGIRDEVYVKALALSDGVDTAVVLGSDLLIIPENIADAVREKI